MKAFVAATVVSASASLCFALPALNLEDAFADTKAIIAGGGQADIVVFGDSLTFGLYPTFRDDMQAKYGNAGEGYQPLSPWTGGGFDTGWTVGQIGSDTPPHRAIDGFFIDSGANPAGGFLNLPTSQVELQYAVRPGGGQFEARLGYWGSVIETINTNAPANGVRSWNHTLASGTQLGVNWLTPDVTLLGVNNKIDTPGVRVHRAANGGWGIGNFVQRDWTFDKQLPLLSPDLMFVWVGANDPWRGQENYAELVNQFVDRLEATAPDAEIVLVGTYDLGTEAIKAPVYAMEQVASQRGLGFINLYETAGSYQDFLDNGWLSDGVHFSASGNAHMSGLLTQAFVTDGASLVPEPGGMVGAWMLLGLLTRRQRKRG